jgi:OmpA-OmpF porin, OOP family
MLKKSLLITAIAAVAVSSVVFAKGDNAMSMPSAPVYDFNPGIVVGLQGGYANTGWDALSLASGSTGIAGRAFVGFDFHKNFAVEGGYTYFGKKASIDGLDTFRTQAFDLVGKMKVPMDNGFGLYAKVGADYLMTKESGSGESENQDHFGVVYGVGASYDITPNFVADLSWTRFGGNLELSEKFQPNADLYALGLAYKFDL